MEEFVGMGIELGSQEMVLAMRWAWVLVAQMV